MANVAVQRKASGSILRAPHIRDDEAKQLLPPSSPTSPLVKRKRFLDRHTGMFRVKRVGAKRLAYSYFLSGYHALIDMNWCLFLILMIAFFLMSFTFFGIVYYAIDELNGCIEHVSGWPETFFFSVQTGMTIGYGSMYPDGCRSIIWAVTIQSIWGLITDAFILGLAFEKLSRPEPASSAFVFSEKAVICNRNGKRVLVCRVAWTKPTQLIESHVRLYISNHRSTTEGEMLYSFLELDVDETNSSFVLLALPHDIVHNIDEDSPLYNVRSSDLYSKDVELVVVVEGISAFTSDTIQGHYSYLSSDIIFDKYLPNIVKQNPDRSFTVDFSQFDVLTDSPALKPINIEIN